MRGFSAALNLNYYFKRNKTFPFIAIASEQALWRRFSPTPRLPQGAFSQDITASSPASKR